MTRDAYRNKWLRFLGQYENMSRKLISQGLRKSASNIPFDDLAKATYVGAITSAIRLSDIDSAYYSLYLSVGLKHGDRVGKGINREKSVKVFSSDSFRDLFTNDLLGWMRLNGIPMRIVTVQKGLIDHLIDFIGLRVGQGEAFDTIVAKLQRYILSKRFYSWQIERIVRTEAVAAANYGASIAGGTSGYVQEKEWISAHDPRTRRHQNGDLFDHWEMDGVKVGENEVFSVANRNGGVDNLRFPGDPKGRAANIINCRCSVAIVPKRDANGRLISTDSRPEAGAVVLR